MDYLNNHMLYYNSTIILYNGIYSNNTSIIEERMHVSIIKYNYT